MANHLGKFSRNLSNLLCPLQALLKKNSTWSWDTAQETAFSAVKQELSTNRVLGLYDPNADAKVSADASSYGLGAVLLQKLGNTWRPIAYASRTMTDAERHYAQIEKEALATTWACEKFSCYLLGKHFVIETDHKPLVPLLGTKHLDTLPPRVLRFRLRLDRYDFSIHHIPGKELFAADTLSRAPHTSPGANSIAFQQDIESYVASVVTALPASSNRLQQYQVAQETDAICSSLFQYCKEGWPEKHKLPMAMHPYWEHRASFTIAYNLLLYTSRIVVPESLQQETLMKIHQGHQGIERCRARAKAAVWWLKMSSQIKEMVQTCPDCAKYLSPPREPMISSTLPDYPWQKVSSDLFQLHGHSYLLVVDYFSRYPEVVKLSSTTSQSIIKSLSSIFARHGIPEELISDNGPQYSSQEFADFARQYNFCHTTSSPHYPQGNGLAERTVKTVKALLSKSSDHCLALLTYRATPFPWCGLSPVELLMGRRVRTELVQLGSQLIPTWSYLEAFQQKNTQFKAEQEAQYNRRHRTRTLPTLKNNVQVWMKTDDRQHLAKLKSKADTPRSYIINSPTGQVRRNRQHITIVPSTFNHRTKTMSTPGHNSLRSTYVSTRSKTGTVIRPPDRLRF